jgi:hypothetical protein
VELVPNSVLGIVEHFEEAIAYRVATEDECGEERLMSIPTSGGDAQDLGPFSTYCPTAGTVEPTLDHKDGALLALGSDGTLRFQPDPGEAPLELGCGVASAALAHSTLAIFSAPVEGGMGLFRYDHGRGEVTVLEPAVAGPFVLDPRKENWLAVTVPHADGTAMVADFP